MFSCLCLDYSMIIPNIYLKRILKYFFIFFISALILTSLMTFWLLRRAVPVVEGKIKLPNLKGIEVKVIRDAFGIPHIEAENTPDAYRVLGYIIASERLFQMEIQRRMAYGELSEIFGKKTLGMDRTFRSLGIKRQSEKIIGDKIASGAMNAQMMKEVDAFFEGVNQFQQEGPLPIEFHLLGIKPRPFNLIDAHAFIGVMSYSFGVAMMQEPLLNELSKKLDQAHLEELRFGGGSKVTKKPYVNHASRPQVVIDLFAQMQKGFPLFEGSNGWVISAKRSASGFPILANDPHVTYSNPGIWFEAHIKTPDFESYGQYLSILPFAVTAHSRSHAWGFTMSQTDDMDFYREKINWSDKTYEFRRLHLPLKEQREVIKVRGEKDNVLAVYGTHHGPLMDHVFTEKNIALKWSFLDDFSAAKDLVSVLYELGQARSMSAFKVAIKDGKAPGLNILYADKKNIAWWMFGDVIIRAPGTNSDFILDGASGRDEPLGLLKFEDKPFLENPESGVIVSANGRPAQYPSTMRGDFQPNDRFNTISHILAQKDKWSLEELKHVQTLSINHENKAILSELLKATTGSAIWKNKGYDHLLNALRKWDFLSTRNSIAPLLFYSWIGHIKFLVLSDLTPNEFIIFSKLSIGSAFHKKILLDEKSLWWQNKNREKSREVILFRAFEMAIKSMEQQIGSDRSVWKWGDLHHLEFSHPLGALKPLNHLFNIGPIPMDGSFQEINNQRYNGLDFRVIGGPSTRRLIDFGKPEKAWGILPTGNSGHVLSPHYKDQLSLFVNGGYREELMDASDHQQGQTRQLIFYSK